MLFGYNRQTNYTKRVCVHKKIAVLLSLLLLIIMIIFFIVWEDEQVDSTPLPTENTTAVFTENDKLVQKSKRFKLSKKADILPQMTPSGPEVNISVPEKQSEVFTLINTKAKSHTVTISDQNLIFQGTTQPIVIVNLFATWCPPCIGEIPYFNDLQK